jgi:futalosine hydrolase
MLGVNHQNAAKGTTLAIIAVVQEEIEGLLSSSGLKSAGKLMGQPFWKAARPGCEVLLAVTGIGKVNAAAVTAWLLARFQVSMVWHLGCAGAYADGPLRVGDVLCSDPVLCGDEGVLTREVMLSTREIGIPLLHHRGEPVFEKMSVKHAPVFQQLIAMTPPGKYCVSRDHGGTPNLRSCGGSDGGKEHSAVADDQFRFMVGPSVTVGLASGDTEVAQQRFRRYGAWAENMEGSAVVQTCLRAEVPMIECRAMSNIAGDRNRSNWRFREAMDHCYGLVRCWLEKLSD